MFIAYKTCCVSLQHCITADIVVVRKQALWREARASGEMIFRSSGAEESRVSSLSQEGGLLSRVCCSFLYSTSRFLVLFLLLRYSGAGSNLTLGFCHWLYCVKHLSNKDDNHEVKESCPVDTGGRSRRWSVQVNY